MNVFTRVRTRTRTRMKENRRRKGVSYRLDVTIMGVGRCRRIRNRRKSDVSVVFSTNFVRDTSVSRCSVRCSVEVEIDNVQPVPTVCNGTRRDFSSRQRFVRKRSTIFSSSQQFVYSTASFHREWMRSGRFCRSLLSLSHRRYLRHSSPMLIWHNAKEPDLQSLKKRRRRGESSPILIVIRDKFT